MELGGTEATNSMSLLPVEKRAWERKKMIKKTNKQKNCSKFNLKNLYLQEKIWFNLEMKERREQGREGGS